MVTDRAAQSQRTTSGKDFEKIVVKVLNEFVKEHGIIVMRAKQYELSNLIRNRSNLKQIIDFTKIPVKRRCTQSQLEDYPDTDLFALIKPKTHSGLYRLLAIINCKVSFHARETESCFWGLVVRLSSNIRYVQATEDKNVYLGQNSELGSSCTSSTKIRRLLEAFCDRVYVMKQYIKDDNPLLDSDIQRKKANPNSIVFDDVKLEKHTKYCHSVRPFDELINDLIKWKEEVPE
jgi:hypothetical protein